MALAFHSSSNPFFHLHFSTCTHSTRLRCECKFGCVKIDQTWILSCMDLWCQSFPEFEMSLSRSPENIAINSQNRVRLSLDLRGRSRWPSSVWWPSRSPRPSGKPRSQQCPLWPSPYFPPHPRTTWEVEVLIIHNKWGNVFVVQEKT